MTFDADFILVDVSPRVQIIDWEPDDVVGRYFFPSDRDEATARALTDALLTDGTSHSSGNVNLRCRDSTLVPVHAHTHIDLDDEGAWGGYRTVLHLPSPKSRLEMAGRGVWWGYRLTCRCRRPSNVQPTRTL